MARRIAALPTHPNLRPDVHPAVDFATAQPAIDALAHPGGVHVPTLWVLDPFDIKSLPFDLVKRCLTRPKDEVLITWFADEIYRFCEVPSFQPTLDAHFGGNHWRSALTSTTEHGA